MDQILDDQLIEVHCDFVKINELKERKEGKGRNDGRRIDWIDNLRSNIIFVGIKQN